MDNYGMPGDDLDQSGDGGPVSLLFGRWQYGLPANWREPVREAMAQTLRFAAEMDMGRMLPTNSLSSTRYCLADADQEYLVYQPESGQFRLNLTGARGPFSVEWFSPATGEKVTGGSFPGGHPIDFTPPFAGEAGAASEETVSCLNPRSAVRQGGGQLVEKVFFEYFLGAAHTSLSVSKLWTASEVRRVITWEGALPLPVPRFFSLDYNMKCK